MEGHLAVDVVDVAGPARVCGPGPSNFAKLRSGPGLRRADVAANQRLRLRTAIALLVFEDGYENVTVRRLSGVAGVSTATFYSHFANTEACLAFACEETLRQIVDRAERARLGRREWRGGLRELVRSIFEQMSERPQDAYLTTIGIHTGDPLATHAARASSKILDQALMRVFEDAPGTVVAPGRLVAGMAAGLTRAVHAKVIAGKLAELPALSGQLAEWMLTLPGRDIIRLRIEAGNRGGTGRWREDLPFPDLGSAESASTGTSERARILAASRRLATTLKSSEVTASAIRREAGVSRRAFDATYANATEAVLDAIEDTAVHAAEKAHEWAALSDGWDRRTYLTIVALCAQAARRGAMTSVVLSDLTRMGRAGLQCRERLITRAATALSRSAPPHTRPSALVTEASLSAAWQIASDELSRTGPRDLPRAAPFLAYVVLAPAVGAREAVTASLSRGQSQDIAH